MLSAQSHGQDPCCITPMTAQHQPEAMSNEASLKATCGKTGLAQETNTEDSAMFSKSTDHIWKMWWAP